MLLFIFITISFAEIVSDTNCGISCQWTFNTETKTLTIDGQKGGHDILPNDKMPNILSVEF